VLKQERGLEFRDTHPAVPVYWFPGISSEPEDRALPMVCSLPYLEAYFGPINILGAQYPAEGLDGVLREVQTQNIAQVSLPTASAMSVCSLMTYMSKVSWLLLLFLFFCFLSSFVPFSFFSFFFF
jgi:hypothetical protein